MPVRSLPFAIERYAGGSARSGTDDVAREEALEIRIGSTPIAVLMRTPGDDEDLVRGFLLTEGIALRPGEVERVDALDDSRVEVRFAAGVRVDPEQFQRSGFTSSSCGVCGKASIGAVHLHAPPVGPLSLHRHQVGGLLERMSREQATFAATGGLHAAGVFALDGGLCAVREDVGRHNAVDKAIGVSAQVRWPLGPSVLVVSGRQSFEIVQKAAMAGIGGIIGVSAPSSLAVELARELGLLLIGFARGDRFNVYAGSERLVG